MNEGPFEQRAEKVRTIQKPSQFFGQGILPNENFPLGNLRFLRVFFEFDGAFPPKKCLKSGGNTGSAFVLFLQVPRKSSVFGSNAEDLRKTGS